MAIERTSIAGAAARQHSQRPPLFVLEALVAKYRIQAHYLRNRAGLGKPRLLQAARTIAAHGLPVTLLHGRADAVCRPANARRLRAAMPGARLVWVDGGHLATGSLGKALAAAIGAARWQG